MPPFLKEFNESKISFALFPDVVPEYFVLQFESLEPL
jgi:hypothetical protein